MALSAQHRIRPAMAISILAVVVSAIAFGIAHSIHRTAVSEYQKRCSLYAVALASTSEAWLQTGNSSRERFRYPLLTLGVVYLRVLIDGEIVMDLRRPEYSAASLPHPGSASMADTNIVRFGSQYAVDVTVPHMLANPDNPEEEGTLRTLQFGINASELVGDNRQATKRVALMSLAAWGVGSGLVVLLACLMWRKRRLASASPVHVPDAARRYVTGNLVLLLDELRFKVGGADIDLTPKQASLLELLMAKPGRAFSDADILEHVWTASSYADSSDVKQQIYLIRKRLRCAGLDASTILATVPGVGYKLVITTDDGNGDALSTDLPHA